MRVREFLFATALLSLALAIVKAEPESWPADEVPPSNAGEHGESAASTPALPPELALLPWISKDKVLISAYYDTLRILNGIGACSDFFGGPAASVEVFNGLIARIKKDHVSHATGMKMSGPATTVRNAETGRTYRLFDKVAVNVEGPFYKEKFGIATPTVPGIAGFRPNSKEVRVLMFLHELGHLIKGTDGKWLLPDDGNNEDLSSANSAKIESLCGDQIRSLAKRERHTKAVLKSDIAAVAQQGGNSSQ